jgi:hypothetical protein
MDADAFQTIQPLLDKIAELAERQFSTDELRSLVGDPLVA